MIAAYPENESARIAALRAYGILDTPPEENFDDLAALAADLCGVTLAAISFIDSERQWSKSIIGSEIRQTPRDVAFCAHTILERDLVVVPDARQDPRFADNPYVTSEPGIRFYAAAPLVTSDDFAIGVLCVFGLAPQDLTEDQKTALRTLARQVSSQLELRRRTAQQDRLVGERARAEALLQLERQRFQSFTESLGSGILLTDLDGEIQFANPRISEITGYSAEEMIGRRGVDLFLQADKDQMLRHNSQRRDGIADRYEIEIVCKDGSRRWLEVSAEPYRDAARRIVGTLATITDIASRKTMEAERDAVLKEAEGRADHDPLTGLLNHRAFHKRLEEEANRAQRAGSALAVVMMDLDNFKFFNDTHGHAVGDEVLRHVATRLQSLCRRYDSVARFGGDEFALLMPSVGASVGEIEARLRESLGDIIHYLPDGRTGVPITVSLGVAMLPYGSADRRDVVRQADERLRRAKSGGAIEAEAEQIRASMTGRVEGFSMLDALVNAVDNKDRYTRKHSEDVMWHCLRIAEELGLDEHTRHTIAVSALLHDVGKIGIPDSVLRKPGKLSDAEFEAVKQHPMMGSIMVGAIAGLEDTLDAVRHHHERWDGGGYPFGLRGEETPLIARLMAVADAYSAMTTDRPYRKGMEPDKALNILREGRGTQWDPDCVDAFLRRATSPPVSRTSLTT